MTLPTFLGIGVPKAGTTWLHHILDSHPAIYVPQKRREIHYYDRYFDRGQKWYQNFFPAQEAKFRAIGEITPHYLYCQQCPARILSTDSVSQLILILRNPVERAWSAYWFRKRLDNFTGSFEEFVEEYPNQISWGFYHAPLLNYLKYFHRDQLLILIYEKDLVDGAHTRTAEKIANFLDVNPFEYDIDVINRRKNVRYMPKLRRLYRLSITIFGIMRHRGLYWIPNLAKRAGIKRLFGSAQREITPMPYVFRNQLVELYAEDIEELQELINTDLSIWQ